MILNQTNWKKKNTPNEMKIDWAARRNAPGRVYRC